MATVLQSQLVVTQANENGQSFSQDEKFRALDEAHQRYLHDLATDIEEAYERGIAEGRASVKIARNMRAEGLGVEVIARMTGLSPTEIEQLN